MEEILCQAIINAIIILHSNTVSVVCIITNTIHICALNVIQNNSLRYRVNIVVVVGLVFYLILFVNSHGRPLS